MMMNRWLLILILAVVPVVWLVQRGGTSGQLSGASPAESILREAPGAPHPGYRGAAPVVERCISSIRRMRAS